MNQQQDNRCLEAAPIPSSMVVTARLTCGRFGVEFGGHQVMLRYCPLMALLTLILARQERITGYAFLKDFDVAAGSRQLLCQTIHRLREDIDTVLGEGVGKSLIEACGSCTYVLRIEPEQIEVSPDLSELTPHLPVELIERLIENAARIKKSQQSKLS